MKWTKASYIRRKLRKSKEALRTCIAKLKENSYEWDFKD